MTETINPKRVLIVLGGLNRGGAQSVVMNYYHFMNRNKIQFDFISHSDKKDELEDEIVSLGGRIFHFPRFKVYNLLEYRSQWINFLKNHHDYLAIHAHMSSTASIFIPIAHKYGIKTIAHAHTSHDMGNVIKRVLEKISFHLVDYMADYFFACSQEAGNFRFGHSVVEGPKFGIWYNAIDLSLYKFSTIKREQIRTKLNVKNDELLIGNVGRLSYPKNQGFLIQVFNSFLKIHPRSKLLLVGNGEMEVKIKALVEKLGLEGKVIFTGSVNNVQDYLSAMDLFVFPSHWEGLPVSVIEAQIAGLYCIISSNVTREVKISPNIEFDDLNKGVDFWVNRIATVPMYSREKNNIQNDNYDIIKAAQKAEEFYLSLPSRI
mgnify:FL=1